MRKKPDRKLVLAAMVLCVAMAAASAAGSGRRGHDDAPALSDLAAARSIAGR